MEFDRAATSLEIDWKIYNFKKDVVKGIKDIIVINREEITIYLGEHNKTKWVLTLRACPDYLTLIPYLAEAKNTNFRAKFLWFIPTKVEKNEICPYREQFEYHSNYYEDFRCGLGLDDLNDLFEDPSNYSIEGNTLTIKIKIDLIDGFESKDTDCWGCRSSMREVFLELESLYESRAFCDFTIVCSDGKEIPTHRLVLAANSPVLKTMLQTQMIESITNKMTLDDINSEVMEEVLMFLYGRNIEHFSFKNFKDIYYVAEKYQIVNLKDNCIENMVEFTDTDCVIEYLVLADFYNDKYLMQRCLMFIKSNYQEVSKNQDLSKLNGNLVDLIKKFIDDYKIKHLSLSSLLIVY